MNSSSQGDRSTNWWHQSNAATSKSGGANSHNLSPSAADDGRSYFRDYENLHAPKAANAGTRTIHSGNEINVVFMNGPFLFGTCTTIAWSLQFNFVCHRF